MKKTIKAWAVVSKEGDFVLETIQVVKRPTREQAKVPHSFKLVLCTITYEK